MRRLLLIAGGAIGAAILIAAAVVGYALLNLNAIIADNRARLLERVSTTLGRPLQVDEIRARVGWGVAIEMTGVKLADDPAFSQLPFVQADSMSLKVELLPLLHKAIRVTDLVVHQPQIRIIRAASGALNVDTVGRKRAATAAPAPFAPQGGLGELPNSAAAPGAGRHETRISPTAARRVAIETFTVEDGRLFYIDQQTGGAPLTVNAVNLKVTNFGLARRFDVALDLAALGDRKNLTVSGTAGPIVQDGAIDSGTIPIDLDAGVGPLTLAEAKAIAQLAKALPPALAISGEIAIRAKLTGTLGGLSFDATSDLSANHVAYAPDFDKPAGTTLTLAASGAHTAHSSIVREATVALADLQAKLTDIDLTRGNARARVDTNRFNLEPVASLIARARPFKPAGAAEIHAAVSFTDSRPVLDGTVTLRGVSAVAPTAGTTPVSNLGGVIRIAGNSADLGPLTFRLGSGNAELQARADSIRPLHASYQLKVDRITVAQLIPARPDAGDEHLVQVAASGEVGDAGGALAGSTTLSAASGLLANVPFTDLGLDANYGRSLLTVNSLKFDAFNGSIGAAGVVAVGFAPAFDFNIEAQDIDMHEALDSQHSKAADTIRGSLTGNLQIAGRGKRLDQVKPTMRGSGRARMGNGKLVGVNLVGQALRKVNNVPGIGDLVPAAVVANHPELFQSPDTDIQDASLTFTIFGPRITSHDIVARSTDYSIFADGWFDLDKNLDLAAKIVMSAAFSGEMVGAKHNVSYLTNSDGEIEIPLRVFGRLPHPTVAPDIGQIAQRAASHAVQGRVGRLIQKNGLGNLLKKNGLGGLLGGFGGSGN